MLTEKLNIEKLYWKDIQKQTHQANPKLAGIIDSINPADSSFFYKANYSYGQKILKQGELQLPSTSDGTIPLNSPDIPSQIQSQLSYCSVPIALILTKSVEVFFETEDRVMPSKLFETGDMFGLWEAFDPPPKSFLKDVWNLSAGARTVFLLPKVSDNTHHQKLRYKHGLILSQAPKTLLDHYRIFYDLAKNSKNKWYCEILFFPKQWLHEKSLSALQTYFLETAWKQSYNCRANMSYDMAWEIFAKDITKRNWNPKPSTISTIKHLLAISDGIYPGFSPACDENAAPIQLIQDAYVNDYGLKKHAPIIMAPKHLRKKNSSVYYSLPLNTLLENPIRSRNSPRIINDLREIKMLLNVLLNYREESNIIYDFYHYEKDKFNEIKSSDIMPDTDSLLNEYPKKYGKRTFPDNSPFVKGCIKITKK